MILIRLSSVQRFMKGVVPQTSIVSMKPFKRRLPLLCIKSNYSMYNDTMIHVRKLLAPQSDTSNIGQLIPEEGDKLIEKEYHTPDADQLITTQNDVNQILHKLHCEKDPKLVQYFERMEQQHVVSEGGYNVMMAYFADQKDFENVKNVFSLLKDNKDIVLHSRSYLPLIMASLSLEDFKQSTFYLEKMFACMGEQCSDGNILKILHTCTEMLTSSSKKDSLQKFVYKIFKVLGRFPPSELGSNLVEAIRVWFENDIGNSWKIQKISIDKMDDGSCRYCKGLKSGSIRPDRLVRLKSNMMDQIMVSLITKGEDQLAGCQMSDVNIVDTEIFKPKRYVDEDGLPTNISAESVNKYGLPNKISAESVVLMFDTLGKLGRVLDNHGPFDVVVDAMNNCYFSKTGYKHPNQRMVKPEDLKSIVDVFIAQRKRILIVCGGFLQKHLLTTQKIRPGLEEFRNLLKYLKRHCSLYFPKESGVKGIDDLALLYTLVHQNFDIQIVSKDLYRDFTSHLDDDNTDEFKRWQKHNQSIVEGFTDGKPVFGRSESFNVSMRPIDDGGWHVPISDKEWYCISKNSL